MSGFCIKAASFRGSGGGGNGNNGTKCGRWNPTTEQVKVLTDLFRSGLRTPSTDQIQKISSQLSFYGKIESKNVFYWFQNHKARERQKRRKVFIDDKDFTRRDQDKISSPKRTLLMAVRRYFLFGSNCFFISQITFSKNKKKLFFFTLLSFFCSFECLIFWSSLQN